jgi:calcium-dependent protein kinase
MDTVAGTPYFMAPEVIEGHYQEKCDIWSLGVVLYMLLSGQLPFKGTSKPEVYGKIKRGNFKMPTTISSNGQDLLKKMLTVDPSKRPNAVECMRHPWFSEMETKSDKDINKDPVIQMKILENLKAFKGKSELRKEALNILVKMC